MKNILATLLRLKNVEKIFCVSKILAQDVKKFTTNKVEIIPNVIDQTIF